MMKRRQFLNNLVIAAGTPLLTSRFATLGRSGSPSRSALKRFKLGVISDEWTQDFEEALKTMKSYGLSWVEIRNVWGIYNTETSPQQLERIKDLLEKYEFKVSMLDTAVYKCALPGVEAVVREKAI